MNDFFSCDLTSCNEREYSLSFMQIILFKSSSVSFSVANLFRFPVPILSISLIYSAQSRLSDGREGCMKGGWVLAGEVMQQFSVINNSVCLPIIFFTTFYG